jgi:hypothetical protein
MNGADRATDPRSDRATDYAAHWPCNPVAFGSPLPGSANDALGMPGMRDRQQCQRDSRSRKLQSCGQAARPRYCADCLDPDFHFNSMSSAGRDHVTPA